MAFVFLTQLSSQSLTAVPGQDITFTLQASSNDVTPLSANYTYQWYTSAAGGAPTLVSSLTSTSPVTYFIDPLIGTNGLRVFATSTFLSGAPATTFVSQITSSQAVITVNEDVPPFNVYDVGTETGRQRHLRLRLLGYV
jgi:hypothetical protein